MQFSIDFELALGYNRGPLRDVVASLMANLRGIIAKERRFEKKTDDLAWAPEAAVELAVTFAQTHLGPYMVNRDIPQLQLSKYATRAMNMAWTSALRDHWENAATVSDDDFVEEVLEVFMKVGEELDLD